MNEILLTLDAGTTGVKAAAFDAEGRLLAAAVEGYAVRYERPGWAEQDPAEQMDAALRALRGLAARVAVGRVVGMGLSGTMNGCIPVDRSGRALYANIIHSDTRTTAQVAELGRCFSLEEFYEITGNRLDPHYGLPKILWLRRERPALYGKTAYFVNIKDYLYGHLTGRHGWTDPSDASLTAAFDLRAMDWSGEILGRMGLDPKRMPRLTHAWDVTGVLTGEMARATGLPAGLPVAMGGGDGACAAQGAGVARPGQAQLNIGSSAWLSVLSGAPVRDAQCRVFQYAGLERGRYVVCGAVQSGAAALQWAADQLLRAVAGEGYEALERLAEQAPPGAEGLFYLPMLAGERTPWWTERASGGLIGFTPRHGMRHVARAAYEGVAQSLALCAQAQRELGLSFEAVTLIGGGAASGLWPRMLASMLGVPVWIHGAAKEATSLGAAMAAGVGLGLYPDFEAAAQVARKARTVMPDPDWQHAYRAHFEVFRRLYPQMREAYEAVYAYQQGQAKGGPNGDGGE